MGEDRHRHHALLYGSSEELVERAVALCRTLQAGGGPVVLGCRPQHDEAIAAALGRDARTTVVARPLPVVRPVAAVAAHRRLIRALDLPIGHRAVLLTEPDHGSDPNAWNRWRRFEAACNLALASYPLTTVCAFDLRSTPDAVRAAVDESHARTDTVDADAPGTPDPRKVLAQLSHIAPLPTPSGAPALQVRGSTTVNDLGASRRRVSESLADLPTLFRTDFVAAVNEVLTNAYVHGRPPVDLTLWVGPTSVECRVSDHGPGFHDPSVGYRPGDARRWGRTGAGLWLARQTCDELDMWRRPGSFTVRLAGTRDALPVGRLEGALARAETARFRTEALLRRIGQRSPGR